MENLSQKYGSTVANTKHHDIESVPVKVVVDGTNPNSRKLQLISGIIGGFTIGALLYFHSSSSIPQSNSFENQKLNLVSTHGWELPSSNIVAPKISTHGDQFNQNFLDNGSKDEKPQSAKRSSTDQETPALQPPPPPPIDAFGSAVEEVLEEKEAKHEIVSSRKGESNLLLVEVSKPKITEMYKEIDTQIDESNSKVADFETHPSNADSDEKVANTSEQAEERDATLKGSQANQFLDQLKQKAKVISASSDGTIQGEKIEKYKTIHQEGGIVAPSTDGAKEGLEEAVVKEEITATEMKESISNGQLAVEEATEVLSTKEKEESLTSMTQSDVSKGEEEEPEGNPWKEYTDVASGHKYYYNFETGVSQWEKPEAMMKADNDKEEPNPEKSSSVWQDYLDPRSGRKYYYNIETGISQWEVPDALKSQGEETNGRGETEVQEVVKEEKDGNLKDDDFETMKQLMNLDRKSKEKETSETLDNVAEFSASVDSDTASNELFGSNPHEVDASKEEEASETIDKVMEFSPSDDSDMVKEASETVDEVMEFSASGDSDKVEEDLRREKALFEHQSELLTLRRSFSDDFEDESKLADAKSAMMGLNSEDPEGKPALFSSILSKNSETSQDSNEAGNGMIINNEQPIIYANVKKVDHVYNIMEVLALSAGQYKHSELFSDMTSLSTRQVGPSKVFTTTIPDGVYEGDYFNIQIGDMTMTLICPSGKNAGDIIKFRISQEQFDQLWSLKDDDALVVEPSNEEEQGRAANDEHEVMEGDTTENGKESIIGEDQLPLEEDTETENADEKDQGKDTETENADEKDPGSAVGLPALEKQLSQAEQIPEDGVTEDSPDEDSVSAAADADEKQDEVGQSLQDVNEDLLYEDSVSTDANADEMQKDEEQSPKMEIAEEGPVTGDSLSEELASSAANADEQQQQTADLKLMTSVSSVEEQKEELNTNVAGTATFERFGAEDPEGASDKEMVKNDFLEQTQQVEAEGEGEAGKPIQQEMFEERAQLEQVLTPKAFEEEKNEVPAKPKTVEELSQIMKNEDGFEITNVDQKEVSQHIDNLKDRTDVITNVMGKGDPQLVELKSSLQRLELMVNVLDLLEENDQKKTETGLQIEDEIMVSYSDFSKALFAKLESLSTDISNLEKGKLKSANN